MSKSNHARRVPATPPPSPPSAPIPYVLAAPDATPVSETPSDPPSWQAPPVRPWESEERRRTTIVLLYTLQWLFEDEVHVERVRDLVHVWVDRGPAIVCRVREWDDAHREGVRQAMAMVGAFGPNSTHIDDPRLLTGDDVKELCVSAVEHVVDPVAVARMLGSIAYHDGPRTIVRGRDGTTLYAVEPLDVGHGALRVRLLGRQFGAALAPMMQTIDPNDDDEERLIPAWDDAAVIKAVSP